MSSTSFSSFPPAISIALFSVGLPRSGHLSIPWLSYWNIKKLSKTLNRRPNQTTNYWVRPNLSITPSESLNTDLLAVFDNSDEDIDFNRIYDKLALKVAVN